MEKKLLISVIIPMYYEEEVIEYTYNRLSACMEKINYNHELIFVDDGSKDNTYEIIKNIAKNDNSVKVIKLSRNFGHQIAVSAGIRYANGDAVILIDADLQDPPELIPDMIAMWESGVKVCYGVREKRNGETKFKLITAKFYYKILDKLSEISIPRDTGDFRLMDKSVCDELKKMREKNLFIRGMVSYVGLRQEPIYYVRDERFAGDTKYNFKKMIKFALNGVISFSSKPLSFIIYLSMVPLFFSIILFVMSIVKINFAYFSTGLFSFFFFLIIVSIWVIGQYIGRIYDETKDRQQFIIESTININNG